MQTATAVLNTLPTGFRLKRRAAGEGSLQIAHLANHSESMTLRMLAQGIEWADTTGRTTGTVAMALRKATPWQAAQLVVAMIADGLELPAQVPSWLNQKAPGLLA